jgi:hypothetical protein
LKKNLTDDAEDNLQRAIKLGEEAGLKQGLRDTYLLMPQIKKAQKI